MITNVILFILASIGMSHIVVDGKILQKFRDYMQKILPEYLSEIFRCYQCSGFWCGAFCGYFLLARYLTSDMYLLPVFLLLCGCAGSFLSPWAAIYLNVLEAKMIIDYKEEDVKP